MAPLSITSNSTQSISWDSLFCETISAQSLPAVISEETCQRNQYHSVQNFNSPYQVTYTSFIVKDDVFLSVTQNPSAPNRSRTYDLPISTSDALPLSYRRIVVARPLNYNLGQIMLENAKKNQIMTKTSKNSFLHPNFPFQCWKIVKCKLLSYEKCYVNITQGWGGAKCAESKIFQHLWPKL